MLRHPEPSDSDLPLIRHTMTPIRELGLHHPG
jgi:hypothetical protein